MKTCDKEVKQYAKIEYNTTTEQGYACVRTSLIRLINNIKMIGDAFKACTKLVPTKPCMPVINMFIELIG